MLAKVSKNAQAEVKADYCAIFDLPEDVEPGLHAVKMAQGRIDAFAKRWRDSYPAAVRSLLTDRDSLTVYLRFPCEHWNRMRHSNRTHLRRNPPPGQGDRPTARRTLMPITGVGGARPGLGGLAGVHHDPGRAAAAAGPPAYSARPTNPATATGFDKTRRKRFGTNRIRRHRITCCLAVSRGRELRRVR